MAPCAVRPHAAALRAALAASIAEDLWCPDNEVYRAVASALPPRSAPEAPRSGPILADPQAAQWRALAAPAALGVWLAGFAEWAYTAAGTCTPPSPHPHTHGHPH